MGMDDYTDGVGVYLYSNGDTFEGNFRKDESSGFGKYIWNNGNRFDGTYVNDKRNGFGRYVINYGSYDGCLCYGEWTDNKITKGWLECKNGWETKRKEIYAEQ